VDQAALTPVMSLTRNDSVDAGETAPTRRDRGLLRSRNGPGHHRVDFVELFFDLVFVFAVTQLSHSLIEHFSAIGAVQTALLTVAVWWVWIYTAWVTNWLDPTKLPVRLALLTLMLPGLILSSSIPETFETRALGFAGSYVTMQVGRTLFFIWAVKGHSRMVRNFQRILAWLVLAGLFWIAGACVDRANRLWLWTVALGVEFVSPSLGFWVPGLGRSMTADWNVEGGHMAERCGLFMIIALGESLLVTGATFAGMAWTSANVAALVVSFVGSLAMFWLYFDTSAELGARAITGSDDPGRIARLVYTYIHLPLVAGVIVSAVADEFVLAHPTGHTDARTSIAALSGAGLFLVGNWLFKWAVAGYVPVSPLVAILAVAGLAGLARVLPPVALMAAAVVVLIASAAWESRSGPVRDHPR
jgi:low temperature requirement protein LtrA